jgi:hypothetical protein
MAEVYVMREGLMISKLEANPQGGGGGDLRGRCSKEENTSRVNMV